MAFIVDIVSNIVANVIFWLGLGLAFWMASRMGQSRFIRFFGVDDSGQISVVVSNLWDPAHSRAKGYSISMHESLAAQSISVLLHATPVRLPELVRGLVDSLWLRSKIASRIEVSHPKNGDYRSAGSLVVIGGSARNSVRSKHIEQGVPCAILESEDLRSRNLRSTEVREAVIRRRGGDVQRIRSELNIAVVEKVVMPEGNGATFYCLGSRGDSTWLAVEYLVRNWSRLAREFSDSPFVVCLGIALPEEFITEFSEPVVLATIRP